VNQLLRQRSSLDARPETPRLSDDALPDSTGDTLPNSTGDIPRLSGDAPHPSDGTPLDSTPYPSNTLPPSPSVAALPLDQLLEISVDTANSLLIQEDPVPDPIQMWSSDEKGLVSDPPRSVLPDLR
jgi:hypothetical protein